MTDEELDRAIASEALNRIMAKRPGATFIAAEAVELALQLRREGWMPPDPLEAEVDALEKAYDEDDKPGDFRRCLRHALKRGIELGKTQP